MRIVSKSQLFLLFTFILGAKGTLAQLENVIFQDSTFYARNKTNQVGLEFSPFFKNNEYFGSSQDGQTYIGYQLQGLGFINISPNAELQLGALATQNFGGHNGFSNINPVATLLYYHKTSTFIAGTLKGAAHHNLIEPLYQIERFYTDRNENGFQYLLHTSKTHFDAWIDWEINTEREINRQEVFTSAFNLKQTYQFGKVHSFSPNAQFVYRHMGPSNGASPLPLRTLINSGIGAEYTYLKNGKKLRLLSYFVDYRDLSISPSLSFLDGFGHYHTIQFSPNKNWDFLINYWEGTEWQSSVGGAIYQAVNPFDRRFPERKKQLIFAKVHFHQMIDKNLMIDIRFDPYFDFNRQVLEPSYSLNLRYSGLFL